MNAKTDESHGAVAGQVERSVRPRAWIGPVWQLMNDSIYEAWSEKYPDDAQHFAPLYDQAALDAAVAAERERWRSAAHRAVTAGYDELPDALYALDELCGPN